MNLFMAKTVARRAVHHLTVTWRLPYFLSSHRMPLSSGYKSNPVKQLFSHGDCSCHIFMAVATKGITMKRICSRFPWNKPQSVHLLGLNISADS